jgi:hypothetical protein
MLILYSFEYLHYNLKIYVPHSHVLLMVSGYKSLYIIGKKRIIYIWYNICGLLFIARYIFIREQYEQERSGIF